MVLLNTMNLGLFVYLIITELTKLLSVKLAEWIKKLEEHIPDLNQKG